MTGVVWQRPRWRVGVGLIVGLVLWLAPSERVRHVVAQEELPR